MSRPPQGALDPGGSLAGRVRKILAECAQMGADPFGLGEDESLYDAGMSSRASVNVMLALENEFDLEFPDEMLRRDVFESIASIAGAVARLLQPQ